MEPSEEEDRELKSYSDDSVIKLAPSERFLKELLNVPFVFKLVDALLSVASFDSGVIQAACGELRNSKMLLKFLEVVFERGTESGNALDFKLEALLVSISNRWIGNFGSVLVDVKKSAEMDYGVLRSEVWRLYRGVQKISEVLLLSEENGGNEEHHWWKFRESMAQFLETAAEETKKIEREEGCVLCAVKEITECFHGDSATEEAQILRVFVIVRGFLKS